MKTFDPVDAYRQFLERLCNGDFDLAETLVSADCVFHVAGAADSTYRGPMGLRTLLQGARSPFSSLTFRLALGPLVQGDWLAARWSAEGVYGGGFPGAPAPPGTAVAFGGHDFLRFQDGRFVEYWGGADDAHLMTQLGMFG